MELSVVLRLVSFLIFIKNMSSRYSHVTRDYTPFIRQFDRNQVASVLFALRTYRRWNSPRSLGTLRSIVASLFRVSPTSSRVTTILDQFDGIQQFIPGSFSSLHDEQIEDILDMSRIAYNEEANDDDYDDEYNSYQSS